MPLPVFVLDLVVPGTPVEVWGRLWDLDRHTRHIPLTRVASADGRPLGPGSTFTGRTGLGPVGFDDEMVVTSWEPPHRAVVDKVGAPLRGRILVVLTDATTTPGRPGTRVVWQQSYGAALVPDRVAELARPAVRAAYRTAIRRITAA